MGTDNKPKVEARASARFLKMSANKARRVINQIRGRSYEQALILLEFMPYRACYPILQLISSAAANANHNLGLSRANLFISEAKVDESTLLKRFQPRAQGRGYPIHKPTCHVTITMIEKTEIGT
uniref:Large ribosomal subunit protein uL22c n=1 Tax=Ptisana novoguineensis TaxID=2764333 RepID=A0A7G7YI14_9MONI|nr:ribosomal protein L22 [Ptisana novoguineensis]QNH94134.1 ribosomal protein L22 [Ptisana novoguineensis]